MIPRNNIGSIVNSLYFFWAAVGKNKKRQVFLLLALMVLTSVAEMISIGAVLPFLGILTSPESLFNYPVVQKFVDFLDISSPSSLLPAITIFFVLSSFVSAAMRILLLWLSTRLAFDVGAEISIDIYRKVLFQPYKFHLARNSSQLINVILIKTSDVIYGTVMPALNFISFGLTLIAILMLLIVIAPILTFGIFGLFCIVYISIINFTKGKVMTNSLAISRETNYMTKSLQEGFGGIRDVLINGTQSFYSDSYRSANGLLRRAQASNIFIAGCPRFIVEFLAIVTISLLAYMFTSASDGIAGAIPALGVIALGAQRMLPMMQQLYGAWSSIQGNHASALEVQELHQQKIDCNLITNNNVKMKFEEKIQLVDVSFGYDSAVSMQIQRISISINKGERVGFVGKTGSGKSTLLDIMMGLIDPTSGGLYVDGVLVNSENKRSWQNQIAHVPQSIFLADASINENIALGVPKDEIDFNRVIMAAKQAELSSVIEDLPEKYHTVVGERGVRLSGGQRQRIAIARALYKQANLIIFDEATSALDGQTEDMVMNAINSLNKHLTILIAAHRVGTLSQCTQIIDLNAI
jgi:ABC-type multidrug transport system fused ATPase/permease subunit